MAEKIIPISIVRQNRKKAPLNLQIKLLAHILILLVLIINKISSHSYFIIVEICIGFIFYN